MQLSYSTTKLLNFDLGHKIKGQIIDENLAIDNLSINEPPHVKNNKNGMYIWSAYSSYTVKPVLSGHSTNNRQNKSQRQLHWSLLQYFWPTLSGLENILDLPLSDGLRQVLLYDLG